MPVFCRYQCRLRSQRCRYRCRLRCQRFADWSRLRCQRCDIHPAEVPQRLIPFLQLRRISRYFPRRRNVRSSSAKCFGVVSFCFPIRVKTRHKKTPHQTLTNCSSWNTGKANAGCTCREFAHGGNTTEMLIHLLVPRPLVPAALPPFPGYHMCRNSALPGGLSSSSPPGVACTKDV